MLFLHRLLSLLNLFRDLNLKFSLDNAVFDGG